MPGSAGGSWAWDVPKAARDLMLANGCTRDIFYDPAYPEQNNNPAWFYAGGPPLDLSLQRHRLCLHLE